MVHFDLIQMCFMSTVYTTVNGTIPQCVKTVAKMGFFSNVILLPNGVCITL
jgi:hypothetical protein